MHRSIVVILFSVALSECRPQNQEWRGRVGGPCEGCEAIYEFGDRKLSSVDTLPGFRESESKLLLKGTVYKKDGVTPAMGVILYVYQTNSKGIYEKKGDETGWGKRHGFIRGWVKTDREGHYKFYTFRPGHIPTAPSRSISISL